MAKISCSKARFAAGSEATIALKPVPCARHRLDRPCYPWYFFTAAGVEDVDVVAEGGIYRLGSADEWWPMVLGTGYRGTVEQLDLAERERVRLENLDFIRQSDVHSVQANVVYAVAVRR